MGRHLFFFLYLQSLQISDGKGKSGRVLKTRNNDFIHTYTYNYETTILQKWLQMRV